MTLAAQFGDGKTLDIGCATVPGERAEEWDWVAKKMEHFIRKLLVRITDNRLSWSAHLRTNNT